MRRYAMADTIGTGSPGSSGCERGGWPACTNMSTRATPSRPSAPRNTRQKPRGQDFERRGPAPASKERSMAYKVIQWATGAKGMVALQEIIRHPDLDLVGLRV